MSTANTARPKIVSKKHVSILICLQLTKRRIFSMRSARLFSMKPNHNFLTKSQVCDWFTVMTSQKHDMNVFEPSWSKHKYVSDSQLWPHKSAVNLSPVDQIASICVVHCYDLTKAHDVFEPSYHILQPLNTGASVNHYSVINVTSAVACIAQRINENQH